MGQVRHGSATTTFAVRAAIQRSQASLSQLSGKLGINPKTVAKWRKRATVEDLKTGPREPRSTVLTEAEEAMIVAFRRHTLLPLDNCLYALQPHDPPHLTRSALHRCLQRHGISRLPDVEGDKPKRQKFKRYPIGFFHIHCPAGDCEAICREGHRGGADIRGQALPIRGHRPDQQVCRDPARRQGRQEDGMGVPAAHARGGALSRPHHPDGQWNPVRRAAAEQEHDPLPADALRHDLPRPTGSNTA